ncbi:hypothetical protein H8356DRAFT_1726389 [Neocallimastix lanati (nom. inval.)]|jgi:hypothetical protein|uniref:Uncharacterized protein n=1 Tax=Neocallimastix californiae TaxID=1754190 RepID=A0A1Y2BSL3_9FUNG|nr:hypothetical protein H8356DRAFT_1726389 [Neocallimastix sp. JGI-2020a]ORY37739.1 hypothetical protein LY90DRAFT_704585 [Neocallimastix californiae]|eukprot:ORY37739.1 hypothetical protein LY90DRAFT_704585 [Neocallimastix californiae]
MNLSLLKLLGLYTINFLIVKANSNADDDKNIVTLETYFNGELYPYTCSQGCKKDYERYQACFNALDNEFINTDFSELCDKYKFDSCKNFIEDLFKKETYCTTGPGPEDFNVHDEITMNKIFYIATCATDGQGNYCDFSQHIQNKDYAPVNLYHMKDDVNGTLSISCNSSICRESLVKMLEYLIPLYKYDVSVDIELSYEKEYIENDERSLAILNNETCVSQDPITQEQNLNGVNTLNIISIVNIIFISIISLLLF